MGASIDSGWFGGFAEFAEQRLLSLAADHVLPGFRRRIVDLVFELRDVHNSLRALGSDHPVLEVPLPSPYLGRFDVFVIVDKLGRCGLWVWLDTGREMDRFVL